MGNVKVHEEGGQRYVTVDGNLHSIDDEPGFVWQDGTKFWYRAGKLHRESGPAVVYPNGAEEWFRGGVRHRTDGPAVIYPDSGAVLPEFQGVKQFWTNGRLIREELPPRVASYRAGLEALRKQHFGS